MYMVYTCSFLGNQLLQRCCWAAKGAVVIQRVKWVKSIVGIFMPLFVDNSQLCCCDNFMVVLL